VVGAISAGLGTIFHFHAHESTHTEVGRKAYYRGEADPRGAHIRVTDDVESSYFQSEVLVAAGLIAVALCYILYSVSN
jgi:hypothetical protein